MNQMDEAVKLAQRELGGTLITPRCEVCDRPGTLVRVSSTDLHRRCAPSHWVDALVYHERVCAWRGKR